MSTVAIAPQHPMGQGSQVKGGHHDAYMAQPDFLPTDKLELLTQTCRWRQGTHGACFYAEVLAKAPKTVAEAIALSSLPATEVQKHLRWLYTWTGELAVNGKRWEETVKTVAPRAKRAPKAKAPKAKVA